MADLISVIVATFSEEGCNDATSKPTMSEQTQAKEVVLIAKRIVEFELAGHSSNIQGAILADLLAIGSLAISCPATRPRPQRCAKIC